MLTIREPIKIVARSSMIGLSDDLSQKIEANYQVLASALSPENMLHFITESPAVYMEGESMTSLVTVDNRINTQQINVELVNNVLNRVLLSVQEELTYQDRVFIDMVLSKIGITDVKQFMHQTQILQQNTKNVNRLLQLYNKGGDAINELHRYFNEQHTINDNSRENNITNVNKYYSNSAQTIHNTQSNLLMTEQLLEYKQENTDASEQIDELIEENIVKQENIKNELTQQQQSTTAVLHLQQDILNRLDTATIYQELENFYEPIYVNDSYIDSKEFSVSEQLLQVQNFSLNQIKNDITLKNEPLEYHVLNAYELGTHDVYESESTVTNELVEAVVLNALNQVYTLRQQQINEGTNNWYDMTESLQQTIGNTLNRFEEFHGDTTLTYQEADMYNLALQQNFAEEVNAIENLYEQYRQDRKYSRQEISQRNQIVQEETHVHGQQINYLTNQEELLKQQLNQINETNQIKQQQLQNIVNNIRPTQTIQINRSKAMEDARRAIEKPNEVLLEYIKQENILDRQEIEIKQQLSQVIEPDVMRIFEQIEKYQKDPSSSDGSITTNEAALDHLMQDSAVPGSPQTVEILQRQIERQTNDRISNTRNEEIKNQIEKIVTTKTNETRYESQPGDVELLHRTSQNSVDETILEEIRNVSRNVNRNIEQHEENLQETRDIYKTVTNQVNQVYVQDNEQLKTMISNNVSKQLGNISDQVYRRIEKKMDTERRRRGL